jgi:hypothetical protein
MTTPTPTVQESISQFDIRDDGVIHVRKTTVVTLNGAVIGSQHWRTVLQPNDPKAVEVLGEGSFYLNQAQHAWASLESGNA